MNSLIFRTGAKVFLPPLLLLSIVILFQGHNEPGGGFVGGLVAAAAFALHSMAFGSAQSRRLIRVDLFALFGTGLLAAAGAAVWGLLAHGHPLQGDWHAIDVPGLGHIKYGNIPLFDIGVYLTVLGVMLIIIFNLEEN